MYRVSALLLLSVSTMSSAEEFYVVAPDSKTRQVISVRVSDANEEATFTPGPSLKLPFGPSTITAASSGNRLYLTSGGHEEAHLANVRFAADGSLQLDGTTRLKYPTGYTSIDRSGRFFFFANYRTGRIGVHRIDESGRVAELVCSIKTPNTEAHCILTSPDNQFAYVPCVKNNNALYQFAFNPASGKLTPLEPFNAGPPAMFGPRHVAYHDSLPIAYFSNEQQLGISVYQISRSGQLKDRQHATTIPRRTPFEAGKRDLHASDLVMSADRSLLFVAVRDFNQEEDSIFTFRIGTDGLLSLQGRTKVGDIPWKLGLSPHGTLLLVSCTGDQTLSAFKILSDGRLTFVTSVSGPVATRDFVVVSPSRI